MISYREEQRSMIRQILSGSSKVSIVAPRVDFRADPARCLTAVALLPDALAQQTHSQLIAPLAAIEPHQFFYRPGEMHLTIKGVRVIADPPTFDEADVKAVDAMLGKRIPQHPAITFALEEVVAFPASLAISATSEGNFGELVRDLDAGLIEVGVPDNKRYVSDRVFFGSITFCRFTSTPSAAFLEKAKQLVIDLPDFEVKLISLIDCNAVCAEDTRRIINRYELGSAPKSR